MALSSEAGVLASLTSLEPDQLFRSSSDTVALLRQALTQVAKVYTEGFDVEQVWEQLQMRDRPVLKSAQKKFTKVDRSLVGGAEKSGTGADAAASDTDADEDKEAIDETVSESEDVSGESEDDGSEGEDEGSEGSSGGSEDDGDGLVASDDDDAHMKRIMQRMNAGDSDVEDEDDENEDSEDEEGGESEFDDEDDEDDAPKKDIPLSRHQQHQLAMAEKIKKLEDELVGPKNWTMMGEAPAKFRPQNSLLDATLDYEIGTKIAPEVTVETTQTLEDMIKQRVRDEAWDDVVRVEPEKKQREKGALAEVSQEKSKLGLGEVYEEEYKRTALGIKAEDADDKKREEVRVLFKQFCARLDALTNFHFTPKVPSAEVTVVQNVPTVAMEEVLPLAVNDNMTKAPEEVYAKKAGRAGVLVGRSELTPSEKQADRRAKKAARSKQRKQDKKVVRLEKAGKAFAASLAAKNVVKGKESAGAPDKFGRSNQFFAKLQERAEMDKASGKHARGGDKKKRKREE